MAEFRYKDFVGKKALFKGDVGSGKTLIMHGLLVEAVNTLPEGSITLIDMAPPKRAVGEVSIGGPVQIGKWVKRITYMRPEGLKAPRLEGVTGEGVFLLAKENAERIDPLLERYLEKPTEALLVNDLTIYLHGGDFGKITQAVGIACTFIGNAYEGKSLSEDLGSGITARERLLLADFEELMDTVVVLGH